MAKLPFDVNLNYLINDLRTLSWEAADTLLYYSNLLKDPNFKNNILQNKNYDDPVTLADLKVNEMIIKKINENYRNVNWEILSEENVKHPRFEERINKDWIWVLDPLDGTKDFIQGTSNYAMHLALNYKQKPYLGVVLIPAREELWIADGEIVWCENRSGKKIIPELSKKVSFQDMNLVTSKNHRNESLRNLINKINFKDVIIMGSIGCKIASIIRGESDIYICLSLPGKSSPKDWDFAAPEAILNAAGGKITNLDNEDLSYGKPNFLQGGIIIASNNSEKHGETCLKIKEIIKKNNLYPL